MLKVFNFLGFRITIFVRKPNRYLGGDFFTQVYAKKVWRELSDSKKRFELFQKVVWGPTVGWRNRTSRVPPQDYLISKYFRGDLPIPIAPSGYDERDRRDRARRAWEEAL